MVDNDAAWKKIRKTVLAEESLCYLCGLPADQVDHVLPVSTHPHLRLERGNLRACCGPCNRRKGNRVARVAPRPACPECGSSLGPNTPGRTTHWCL